MNTIALRTAVAYQLVVARLRAVEKERGATAVEYALMVGLIAAVIIVAVTALGGSVSDIFDKTSKDIHK
jgi:pilus assembly protein Flp/PilA